jgi:two-component system chemotaxis sensor kinase CheA
MENIRAFMLVNKLETVGKVICTIPEELNANKDASSIISQNGFYCSVETDLTTEEIASMVKGTLSVYTVEFINALPTGQAKTDTAPAKTESGSAAASAASSSANDSDSGASGKGKTGKQQNLISVDLNKLDTLMDLVGEIVITESMVSGSADLVGWSWTTSTAHPGS